MPIVAVLTSGSASGKNIVRLDVATFGIQTDNSTTATDEFDKLCFDYGLELDEDVRTTYVHCVKGSI